MRIQPRGVIEPRPFRQRVAKEEPVLRIEPMVQAIAAGEDRGFVINRIGEVVRLESALPVGSLDDGRGFLPERAEPKFVPATKESRQRRGKGVGHDWGSAGQHSRGWIALTVFGVVGLLAGGLLLQSKLVGRDEAGRDGVQLTLEPELEVDLGAMFDADLKAEGEARRLLAAVVAARRIDELLPLVRGGERMREQIAAKWQPWDAPEGWQPNPGCVWEVGQVADRGFGILSGFRPDFQQYRAYFVREGGSLVLDWEATEAVSDDSFERLARGEGGGGLVRVYARRGDFYTVGLPEDSFRAMQLISPKQDAILWGYARRGGSADEALQKFFDDGLIVEAEASILPLTLRLVPLPPDSLSNQWEITEVLHEDWVQP